MFPAFTNAALLMGLIGLTAPILAHLLLRRRSQRLRFSTIQFFAVRDEASSRRRKLRNWLLLAARLLLFALIVFGFARPFIPGGSSDPGLRKQRQVVIVLDASASMRASGSAGTQWGHAKQMASQALLELRPGDRSAVLRCSSRVELISSWATPAVTDRAIQGAQPDYGAGEIAQGIRVALRLLEAAEVGFDSSILIVSDLQRNGCEGLSAVRVPKEVTLRILDLGDRFVPNLGLSGLELGFEEPEGPHAQLTSWSDAPEPAAQFAARVDGKEVISRAVLLASGSVSNISLKLPALAPGWHSVEAEVRARDGYAADDSRFQTLFVPEPLRVLVVEPRKTDRVFQEESFFVVTAFDPTFGNSESLGSRFAVRKAGLRQLSGLLQVGAGQAAPEVVVLPAVQQWSSVDASALVAFVKSGGGLLLFLGDSVSVNRYHNELSEVLPARLGALESKPVDGSDSWRIGDYDKAAPMFRCFLQANSGNLHLPEFSHRLQLNPAPESLVRAEFDDGAPFIVERRVGKGLVALVNSSADCAWTDWPKHKTFVPWLHTAGSLLSRHRAAVGAATLPPLVSGLESDIELGKDFASEELVLRRVGDVESVVKSDSEGKLRDARLDLPGIYSVSRRSGLEILRFAVNTPTAESDLIGMTPMEFETKVAWTDARLHPTRASGLISNPGVGIELWRLMLFGALILLILEPLVANRTLA